MTGPVFVDTDVLVLQHDNSDVARQTLADAWHRFRWHRLLDRLNFRALLELRATVK